MSSGFYEILLVIHTILILFLIVIILLQRSDADGLSGLGGGGGAGNLLTGRGSANLITRTTAILAACFIITSLTLAIMSGHRNGNSIVDQITDDSAPEAAQKAAEGKAGENSAAPKKAPAAPATPAEGPAVPKPE